MILDLVISCYINHQPESCATSLLNIYSSASAHTIIDFSLSRLVSFALLWNIRV